MEPREELFFGSKLTKEEADYVAKVRATRKQEEHDLYIMKAQEEKHLKCPCCKSRISPTSLEILSKQIATLEMSHAIWWATDANQIIQKISEFQWACDDCLRSGKAIIAHPEKQTFCNRPPFLAYFDSEKICSTCEQVFLFWANEQIFWYETLKFWVQSKAKNCLACRKKARERKNQIPKR